MIIYNNGANGTLKPPILNGIEQINSSNGLDFNVNAAYNVFSSYMELHSNSNILLSANSAFLQISPLSMLSAEDINLNAVNTLNLNAVNSNISAENININAVDTLNIQSVNMSIAASFPIAINQPITLSGFTTAQILAITPAIEGMQVYCTDIQQMVYYQVSPITGTILGWYNSTGTIKL